MHQRCILACTRLIEQTCARTDLTAASRALLLHSVKTEVWRSGLSFWNGMHLLITTLRGNIGWLLKLLLEGFAPVALFLAALSEEWLERDVTGWCCTLSSKAANVVVGPTHTRMRMSRDWERCVDLHCTGFKFKLSI